MKIHPINNNIQVSRNNEQKRSFNLAKSDISFKKAYLTDNFIRTLCEENIPLSKYAFVEQLNTEALAKRVLEGYVSNLKNRFAKDMFSKHVFPFVQSLFWHRTTGMSDASISEQIIKNEKTQQIFNNFNKDLDDDVKLIVGKDKDKLDFDFYIDRHTGYAGEVGGTDIFIKLGIPNVYHRQIHRLNYYTDNIDNEDVIKEIVENIVDYAANDKDNTNYEGDYGKMKWYYCEETEEIPFKDIYSNFKVLRDKYSFLFDKEKYLIAADVKNTYKIDSL